MYSETVLDHFRNPRHTGDLAGATAIATVNNPACGDVMRLSVRVENGHFVEVRFLTRGCVTAIACGSWLVDWMQGKTIAEVRAMTPRRMGEELGGLPPATEHGSHLACDALAAILVKVG